MGFFKKYHDEVHILAMLFFALLAGVNFTALIQTVAVALESGPPAPGLASFVINCFGIAGAVGCAVWCAGRC